MSDIENLAKELKSVDKRRGEVNYATNFEEVLAKFVELRDPVVIGILIEFFDDDAPFDEVMFSIIHTIEGFADGVYVQRVLGQRQLKLPASDN